MNNTYRTVFTIGGMPWPGLKPVWMSPSLIGSGFGAGLTNDQYPAITDLGNGMYEWAWDAEAKGDMGGFLRIPDPPSLMTAYESTQYVEARVMVAVANDTTPSPPQIQITVIPGGQ